MTPHGFLSDDDGGGAAGAVIMIGANAGALDDRARPDTFVMALLGRAV